jgi:hypothetical protein
VTAIQSAIRLRAATALPSMTVISALLMLIVTTTASVPVMTAGREATAQSTHVIVTQSVTAAMAQRHATVRSASETPSWIQRASATAYQTGLAMTARRTLDAAQTNAQALLDSMTAPAHLTATVLSVLSTPHAMSSTRTVSVMMAGVDLLAPMDLTARSMLDAALHSVRTATAQGRTSATTVLRTHIRTPTVSASVISGMKGMTVQHMSGSVTSSVIPVMDQPSSTVLSVLSMPQRTSS